MATKKVTEELLDNSLVSSEFNASVKNLLDRYDSIYDDLCSEGEPAWAVRKCNDANRFVHPTIPFVGKDYFNQRMKILLYASAENLSTYSGHLDEDILAKDRHRYYFSKSSNRFFPLVHIQPMQDGCLMNVLRYVCDKLGITMPDDPKSFLENIAFGNFCKYSIQSDSKRNIDYASNHSCLKFSLEYVATDLDILKPDIIIMPKKSYDVEKSFISEHCAGARILPIMQINARNINMRIAPKFERKDLNELSSAARQWYEKLGIDGITGKTKANYLSVYTYLDEILEKNI